MVRFSFWRDAACDQCRCPDDGIGDCYPFRDEFDGTANDLLDAPWVGDLVKSGFGHAKSPDGDHAESTATYSLPDGECVVALFKFSGFWAAGDYYAVTFAGLRVEVSYDGTLWTADWGSGSHTFEWDSALAFNRIDFICGPDDVSAAVQGAGGGPRYGAAGSTPNSVTIEIKSTSLQCDYMHVKYIRYDCEAQCPGCSAQFGFCQPILEYAILGVGGSYGCGFGGPSPPLGTCYTTQRWPCLLHNTGWFWSPFACYRYDPNNVWQLFGPGQNCRWTYVDDERLVWELYYDNGFLIADLDLAYQCFNPQSQDPASASSIRVRFKKSVGNPFEIYTTEHILDFDQILVDNGVDLDNDGTPDIFNGCEWSQAKFYVRQYVPDL